MYRLLIPSAALLICASVPMMAQPQPAGSTVIHADLSAMASSILSESRQAQAAVNTHDKPGALTHVNEALSLAAHIEQFPHAEGLPQLIPVSIEVETTSVYRPAKRNKSDQFSADRLAKDSNIRDSTAEITRSALDVTAAHNHLESARTALEAGDFATAERSIAGVQNAVVSQSANENVPLLRARQNLELARARVVEGKYKDAVVPLQSAAQALDEYRQMPQAPHGDAARDMVERINAYAGKINKDRGDALTYIDTWLDPVSKWYTDMIR